MAEAIEKSAVMDKPLKALIVSSPTYTHEEVIKEAVDNKLAIFTEKPVAETANQISDLFDYADTAGVLLCCEGSVDSILPM